MSFKIRHAVPTLALALAVTLPVSGQAAQNKKQQTSAKSSTAQSQPVTKRAAAPAKRASPEIVRKSTKQQKQQTAPTAAQSATPQPATNAATQKPAMQMTPTNDTAAKTAIDAAQRAKEAAASGNKSAAETAAADATAAKATTATNAALAKQNAEAALQRAVEAKAAADAAAARAKTIVDTNSAGLKTGVQDGAMTAAGKNLQSNNGDSGQSSQNGLGNNQSTKGTGGAGLSSSSPTGTMTAIGNSQSSKSGTEDNKNATATVDADGKVIGTTGGVANTQSPYPGLARGKVDSARDAGSFGGDRANARTGGSGAGNINPNAGGKGHASDDASNVAQSIASDTTKTISDMLKAEGGTPTGDANKDAAELGYAQKVGSDGYAATKNMSAGERAIYWDDKTNKQLLGGAGRPREDGGAGPATPLGNALLDRKTTHQPGLPVGGAGGPAGGGSDPRTDSSQGQGSGGAMITRGADDGRVKTNEAAGTLSMEKMLQINQTTNPVRTGAQK